MTKDKYYYSDGTTSSERDCNKTLHREDGPAIKYAYGTKEWYLNGKRHRIEGPAVERVNGTKEWYINGKLHRTDGPAVEYANGSTAWYISGKSIVYYDEATGNYKLYDNESTKVTEEQARLLLAKHGIRL